MTPLNDLPSGRALMCVARDEGWRRRAERMGLDVVAVAETGGEALLAFRQTRPDVLLVVGDLDGCDGLRIVDVLLRERECRAVVVPEPGRMAAAQREAERRNLDEVTIVDALALPDPESPSPREPATRKPSEPLALEELPWNAEPSLREPLGLGELAPPALVVMQPRREMVESAAFDVVALLGSAGTPHMLPELLRSPVPRVIPLIVAVHHNPRFTETFSDWVETLVGVPARPFDPATVRDPNMRLQVVRAEGNGLGPDLGHVVRRLTFFGLRVLVCLASGMGGTDIDALCTLRSKGGRVVVLSPDACPQPGMVEAALQSDVVDAVLTLEECRWLIATAGEGSLAMASSF